MATPLTFSVFVAKSTAVERIGGGWTGQVYRCVLGGLTLAVKVAKTPEGIHRLRHEITVLARLQHLDFVPHPVVIGHDFFAYRYIEGEPLGSHDRLKGLPPPLLRELVEKAYQLDREGVGKRGGRNPYKDILIGTDGHLYFTDFDRAKIGRCNNIPNLLIFLTRAGLLHPCAAVALSRLYPKASSLTLTLIHHCLNL